MRTTVIAAAALCHLMVSAAFGQPVIPIQKDIVYCEVGDEKLALDLAQPVGMKGPFPLVVCIQGFGWQKHDRAPYQPIIQTLALNGYVAATMSYRLAPRHKFPAAIEDVKCAVRFLRANAAKYQIDPKRVGAMGESTGGYLALMLGLTGPSDGFDGSGGYADQSSAVQAVANYYGVTDFANWFPAPSGILRIEEQFDRRFDMLLSDYLGSPEPNERKKTMERASPVTYVDSADPPVLTFHGSADAVVPLDQAKRLDTALRNAGVRHEFVMVDGGSHGWAGAAAERSTRRILLFLEKELKGLATAAVAK